MTNKRHIMLLLILASVSQALGGSSNSTEYDCAHSIRCYELSSSEASSKVLIGIITVALVGTLCFTLLQDLKSLSVLDGELLSREEITKNAREIHYASRIKSCIFSRIPDNVLTEIAGLTGDPQVHTQKESENIARIAVLTDIGAQNKPPTRHLNV